jgi:hypothetical protein
MGRTLALPENLSCQLLAMVEKNLDKAKRVILTMAEAISNLGWPLHLALTFAL